jgi:3-hydroxy-9,10-secoandrosta-1,3,5(10)-triene-9,17-dione monooxygenase
MASQQLGDASETEQHRHRMLERARVVATRLAERAPLVDQAREIPPETVRDLHDAGLLVMHLPRTQGGTEIDMVTQMEVLELLGGACASTAWCLGNHLDASLRLLSVMGEAAGPYRQAVVHEGAVIAQGITPTGATRVVPGGFRSSGRWPFISFSPYARWVLLDTLVPGPPPGWQPLEGASTPPSTHARWLIVRLDQTGVCLEPTWRAMALRGSMSHDLLLDDVFVPEACAPVRPRPPAEVPWEPQAPPALLFPNSPQMGRVPLGCG